MAKSAVVSANPTPEDNQRTVPWRKQVLNLARAAGASYTNHRWWRQNHVDAITEYTGHHFRGWPYTSRAEHPINMLWIAMSSLAANIASNDPVADIEPIHTDRLRLMARIMSSRGTFLLRELNVRELEELILLDAMVAGGVVQVGLRPSNEDLEFNGAYIDAGRPGAWRRSPQDYLQDVAAPHRSEMTFEGHRYRADPKMVAEMDKVDADLLNNLPKYKDRNNSKSNVELHGFVDFVDLIDLWVPKGILSNNDALMLTYAGDPTDLGQPWKTSTPEGITIREPIEYEGPEGSPYLWLGFHRVPDSTLDTPPAGFWRDQAALVGALLKSIHESEVRRKEGMAFKKGDEEDAHAIEAMPPNGLVGLHNPGSLAPVKVGGASPTAHQSYQMHKQYFSEMTGSDLLSGNPMQRGRRDVTATEVQEVAQQRGLMLDAMEQDVYRHTGRILERILWYDLTNPALKATAPLRVGTARVDFQITPELAEEFDFFQYNFNISRGSMRRIPSQMMGKIIDEFIGNTVPVVSQLAAQGIVNGPETLQMVARYKGIRPADIERILGVEGPPLPNLPLSQTIGDEEPAPSGVAGTRPGGAGFPSSNQTGAARFEGSDVIKPTMSGMGAGVT